MKKYNLAVCGGTFDLLHEGHRKFLQDILEISDKILIGLTSDQFASRKDLDIQKFEIRKSGLENFLNLITDPANFKIISINDVYGPLLDESLKVDVLIATSETLKGAEEINNKRVEEGLSALSIELIEMKKADDGGLISSTRVRNGEIDRKGRLYVQSSWLNRSLSLPEILRSELQKPFGEVLDSVPSDLDGAKIVTIGDITTQKFNEKKVGQFLSIIDYQVKREKKFDEISQLGFEKDVEIYKVVNYAGGITTELFEVIRRSFVSKKRQVVLVDGEEDLAFIPVMLVSPLGFRIFYGQPNEGLVEVKVTEENKEKVYSLLTRFD